MLSTIKYLLVSVFQYLKNKLSRWFRLKLFSISGKTLKQYFTIQRNSKWRFFTNIYILITLIFCPYLDNMYQNWIESEPYHMYYVIFVCSILNLYFIRFFFTLPGFSFMFDIKEIILQLKHPFFYLNLIAINFKKYFYFIFNERFFNFFNFVIKLFNLFTSKFLLWRPLFKRFSYFGNFRLTNSKFFKN